MPAELSVRSSRVPLSEMNGQSLAAFFRSMRADHFKGGQTAYDTGIGFWIGEHEGLFKLSIGDSAGDKLTFDGVDFSVIANIILGVGKFIRSGQTDYDDGVGFWIGNVGGVPKLSIGDSAGARLTWNGTELRIFGVEGVERTIDNLVLKGDSDTNAAIGRLLGSAVSTMNAGVASEWQALRTFQTDFTGSFRLMVEARRVDTLGAPPNDGSWRLKNGAGTVVHTATFASTVYASTFSGEELVTEAGEDWTVEGLTESDLTTWTLDTQIRDIEVRARFNHATIT